MRVFILFITLAFSLVGCSSTKVETTSWDQIIKEKEEPINKNIDEIKGSILNKNKVIWSNEA